MPFVYFFINMIMSKEPRFVIKVQLDRLEEVRQHVVSKRQVDPPLHAVRRTVAENKIDAPFVSVEIFECRVVFSSRWHFLRPPRLPGRSPLLVVRFRTAHREALVATNIVHLATHEVDYARANEMDI